MAIVIAGERSGVGKTTVTLALLAALRQRSHNVQSFKVGPDYIDPMFHRHVTGRACRNLDPVLTSELYVQQCFEKNTQDAEYALIEGVMGLFDGASGADDFASTAHVSRLLHLPVLLILNCSSLARSIAAIAHGYRSFDLRVQVAGVVLNRVGSDRHLELLTAALEPLNLPILGVLRRQEEIVIPDRHLGLVPSGELQNLQPVLDRLANLGETCFDWEKLTPLLKCDQSASVAPSQFQGLKSKIRLAIAQDSAFNFYYADNLEMLEHLGAELLTWSPLTDSHLPKGTQGLYFGGGFPEVFAAELVENQSARLAVKAAIQAGMPTYAECGGLMYLCEQIVDFSEQSYPMVGIFPATATMGNRLTLGYRQATVLQNTPLVERGDRLWGHEFHRSTLAQESPQPVFNLQGYHSQIALKSEGWQRYQVHASYTHLHFGVRPELITRFLEHCERSNSTS
ncbi:MAG: cobyrinate a,c-diamide synthase [Timaviella obliquedivisa GSE-PSE-MK23-08B]|jgi:cobyrinic acid a,c-diamide synthase|nr:cobyrinate a,c-diamide synthase [Timaviella obliquedivisa GSE-PSE-MK23-08B]